MLNLRKILFPVDFSERCLVAAESVRALADRTGAEVTLFHAVRPPLEWIEPPYTPDLPALGYDFAGAAESLRTERANRLRDFLPDLWDQTRTKRVVESGEPSFALLQYMESEKPDLTMIPTHGHGTFRRLLVGSVTNKLLHDATCPIWTDAHMDKAHSAPREKCTEVLCGVDLTEHAHDRTLIEWAAGFAEIWGARLRLFHAVPGARHSPGTPDEPFTSTLLSWGAGRLATLLNDTGISCETVVQAETPTALIHNLTENPLETVVVIGRGRATSILGRLGSQAYSIIRSSPSPVISV